MVSEPVAFMRRYSWFTTPSHTIRARFDPSFPYSTTSRCALGSFDQGVSRSRSSSQACASWMVSRDSSTMPRLRISTARLSGLSRSPPQVWHGLSEK